jgi:predicted ester cyclase
MFADDTPIGELMLTQQDQENLRHTIEEAYNKDNYDVLDLLFAPDYQEHEFGLAPTLPGLKQTLQSIRSAFPDHHVTIEEMIADTNKVWVRMTTQGTNLGPFMGPPTNKPMTITVINIYRFENGRIVEHWGVADRFAVMAQLGLLPPPEEQKT